MGYSYIPKKHAERINEFDCKYLNPYLNFHRYCGFATDYIDARGKVIKKYEIYMTPIQKLLSLPLCEEYLKENVTKELLILEGKEMTHLESAQKVFVERQKLFQEINRKV